MLSFEDKLSIANELSSIEGLPSLTDVEYEQCLKFGKETSDSCFIWGSEIFLGEKYGLYRRFLKENPSEKFRIWLINKGLRVGN